MNDTVQNNNETEETAVNTYLYVSATAAAPVSDDMAALAASVVTIAEGATEAATALAGAMEVIGDVYLRKTAQADSALQQQLEDTADETMASLEEAFVDNAEAEADAEAEA